MTIWNWKAGILSAVYRASVFFFTALRARGWRLAMAALIAETVFRVVTSGFYGAFIEAVRQWQPAGLSALLVLFIAPAAVQLLEWAVHLWSGTPNVKTSVLLSTAMTALASLFNWYSMRRGALLTGKGAVSFGSDLKRFPLLVYGFAMAIPRAALKKLQ